MKTITSRILLTCSAVLLSGVLSQNVRAADVQYVTTYVGTTKVSNTIVTNNPLGLTGISLSEYGSTAIANPPGVPSRTRCWYAYGGDVNWGVRPTLAPAASGATYRIEVAHTTASTSTNVIVTAWSADGVVSESCTNSPVFNQANGGNLWVTMGTITLNPGVTQPFIYFLKTGGYIDNDTAGTPQRLYIDAFKFTEIDPCDGVVGDVAVTGPLAANNTFVNVSGITAGADTVTVYAGATQIGQTNYPAGFAAGIVAVPTSALTKGAEIKATQAKLSCVSSLSSPAIVGGGANPAVSVALGLYRNSALTGPAGANGTSAGTLYWLSATNLSGGSATAPQGGKKLSPDVCWYTVSFQWGLDPELEILTGFKTPDENAFAALDNLTFAIEDDSGPYDIYVDDIRNGDTIIENFEGYAPGTKATFENPNYPQTTPSAAATYLAGPNSSTVSQDCVIEGTNACRIQWQFANNAAVRWARVMAAGIDAGKKYPQLDTSKPVTMKILVLPVGQSTGVAHEFAGTVSEIAGTNAVFLGTTNTWSVTVTGPGTYTYAWDKDGTDLGIATSSFTLGNANEYGIQPDAAGVYSVTVNDGFCSQSRRFALTVMDPLPFITNQPKSIVVVAGTTTPVMSVGVGVPSPAGLEALNFQWRFNGGNIGGATDSSLSFPSGVQVSDSGVYDVQIYNNYNAPYPEQWITSQPAILTVLPSGSSIGTGAGLTGSYYAGGTLANPFAGAPTLTRVDPEINFSWAAEAPAPGFTNDYFTVRWFGEVQAIGTGEYTFSTVRDDGLRLWVNGQLLLDNWTLAGSTTNRATTTLTGTQKYPIIMEYVEQTGSAVAKLWWSNAFTPIIESAIPASQLYAGTFVAPTVALTAPANPTTVQLPATVSMAATVVANSGLVDKVEFYAGATKIGEAPAAPYTYDWVNPAAGTYDVTAKVVYNKSSSAQSAVSVLTVNAVPAVPVTGVTIAVASGSANINYTGGAGSQFVLVSTPSLNAPITWTRVATNTVTPSLFSVPVGAAPQTFYRILSE